MPLAKVLPVTPWRMGTACRARGLPAGMLVETATGWRRVEALEPGDLIATVEGSLRPLRAALRVAARDCGRVAVPEGVLHNNSATVLPGNQMVMIDGLLPERLFGLSLALARAGDLVGMQGIAPVERAGCDLWQLRFEREEVIWANGGMCLHCPARGPSAMPAYPRLSRTEARRYVRAVGGRPALRRAA
jgi:hypothetical protein